MPMSDAEVRAVVKEIKLPNVAFLTQTGRITVTLLDSKESRRVSGVGRSRPYGVERTLAKSVMGPFHSVTDVLCKVFACVQMLKDHELREWFTYQDVIVFDPHKPQSRTSNAEEFYMMEQTAVLHDPDLP